MAATYTDKILKYLFDTGSKTCKQMATYFNIQYKDVHKYAQRLEKAGFVTFDKSVRPALVTITMKGKSQSWSRSESSSEELEFNKQLYLTRKMLKSRDIFSDFIKKTELEEIYYQKTGEKLKIKGQSRPPSKAQYQVEIMKHYYREVEEFFRVYETND